MGSGIFKASRSYAASGTLTLTGRGLYTVLFPNRGCLLLIGGILSAIACGQNFKLSDKDKPLLLD